MEINIRITRAARYSEKELKGSWEYNKGRVLNAPYIFTVAYMHLHLGMHFPSALTKSFPLFERKSA
jgi:hypothetical protein